MTVPAPTLSCAFAFLYLVGASWCPAQVMLSPAFETDTAKESSATGNTEEERLGEGRLSTGMTALEDDERESGGPRPTYAAAEPDPPLRYRFWPAAANQNPREATPFITRALLLQYQAIHRDAESAADFNDGYRRYSDAAIEDLPHDDVRAFLERYGEAALNDLARAENRMGVSYDLGLDELSVPEAVATLLPELQETRNLARLLQLRARLAIAEGRWDDAVDDLRLGFRLSEFAGQSSGFVLTRMVGMAIAGMMLDAVEEAIHLPDSPNLYWALTTIPKSRLFDATNAIEYELDFWGRMYEGNPPSDGPVGAEASTREMVRLFETIPGTFGGSAPDIETRRLLVGLAVVVLREPSREMLAETPEWAERADQLSASETVWRAVAVKFQRIRDEKLKWLRLPAAAHRNRLKNGHDASSALTWNDPIGILAQMNSVAGNTVRSASDHYRQRLNFLLTIEAIRMDAASRGELPKTLVELGPVPAWDDPITGEPFEFRRTSTTTATLSRAPRFSGESDAEITIELIPDRESQ